MHRCLNVDEIVRLIAYELVESERKATAVCLACCRKSFEDPVLDELWAAQDELSPLFKCLPGDVWKKGGYTSFKRLPTATEWARFGKYARRMRELSADDNPKTLSSEVYFIMKLYTINEPLLPNLTTLQLRDIGTLLVQFIPLFLSPRITSISFEFSWSRPPESMIASVITILPMSCPNLQHINIQVLSRDPMIAAAVSRMTIDIDQNALLTLHVDAPLTEEASEVVSKSQNIRSLSVVIGGGTSIPSASLPNLTRLEIKCDDGSDGLQLLRGTTFGKLESVCFDIESELIGDFLEAFKEAALSSSLLPLTRLVYLVVSFLCDDNCSVVDDDTVIDLSWAMPKLKHLQLGREPCYQFTGGVTTKGLVALAHNCPDISYLCVHFQVASLSTPTPGLETTSNIRHSVSWTGCALTDLMVGEMPIADELESMVALTLLRIFPRIETINQVCNDEWDEVQDLICRSKEIVDCSRARFMAGN